LASFDQIWRFHPVFRSQDESTEQIALLRACLDMCALFLGSTPTFDIEPEMHHKDDKSDEYQRTNTIVALWGLLGHFESAQTVPILPILNL